jgi:hypothetical protein
MAQLSELAKRKKQSMSLVTEAAIASFLTPDEDDRREAAIVRRLDRLNRQVERLERDLLVSVVSLKSAEAATRRLLVENAEKFSNLIGVEPHVYTDLEWSPGRFAIPGVRDQEEPF